MSGKRQKTQQLQLAFMSEGRGEAPMADVPGTEPLAAKRSTESPAGTETLMEAVCSRKNLSRPGRSRGRVGMGRVAACRPHAHPRAAARAAAA